MAEIEIQFASEAEYKRLRAIRDRYGVTWRGMLLFGAQRLDGRVLPRSRATVGRVPYSDGGTTSEPAERERPAPQNARTPRLPREGR